MLLRHRRSRRRTLLKAKIDDIVDYTLNARLMNTRDQAAWQIVHGIEAYGRDLPLEHDGQVSSALDYLLGRRSAEGLGDAAGR